MITYDAYLVLTWPYLVLISCLFELIWPHLGLFGAYLTLFSAYLKNTRPIIPEIVIFQK